jgi:hypothetical protein
MRSEAQGSYVRRTQLRCEITSRYGFPIYLYHSEIMKSTAKLIRPVLVLYLGTCLVRMARHRSWRKGAMHGNGTTSRKKRKNQNIRQEKRCSSACTLSLARLLG